MKINVKNRGRTVNPEDLKLLNLHDQNLEGALFTGDFDSISIARSVLRNCNFKRIRCASVSLGGGLSQSVYYDCIFENCTFRFFAVGNARLIRCQFIDCELDDLIALDLELLDCQFISTKIKRGVFHGKVYEDGPINNNLGRTTNEFRGNDFSSAELIDVDFRGGIDLKQQKLPTSDDYLYIPDIRAASKALDELQLPAADAELHKIRRRLKSYLDIYKDDVQRDQLFRVNFPRLFRDVLSGASSAPNR